jgi:hypothetical protein
MALNPRYLRCLPALAAAAALCMPALDAHAETGKLRLTGGVSSIDGAAGGGLTPWGVIGTQATAGQWGASAFVTQANTPGYQLQDSGVALAWNERLELSFARQRFDTRANGAAVGLPGLVLQQDIVGVKWRVAGDAVLDSDLWMPSVAVGLQAKQLDAGGLAPTLAALGARRSGTDVYVSATKLFLAQGIVVNGTLRATQANQNGLLGFGGTAHRAYSLQPEASLAWLLHRTLAVGVEYRAKPDNLNPSLLGAGLKEDDWTDAFIAWAPTKHVSLTAAWVDLGRIVPAVDQRRQRGGYLSLQLAY